MLKSVLFFVGGVAATTISGEGYYVVPMPDCCDTTGELAGSGHPQPMRSALLRGVLVGVLTNCQVNGNDSKLGYMAGGGGGMAAAQSFGDANGSTTGQMTVADVRRNLATGNEVWTATQKVGGQDLTVQAEMMKVEETMSTPESFLSAGNKNRRLSTPKKVTVSWQIGGWNDAAAADTCVKTMPANAIMAMSIRGFGNSYLQLAKLSDPTFPEVEVTSWTMTTGVNSSSGNNPVQGSEHCMSGGSFGHCTAGQTTDSATRLLSTGVLVAFVLSAWSVLA